MEVRPQHLPEQLQAENLSPLFFVAGSEWILVDESVEAIVDEATRRAFEETIRLSLDQRTTDWESLLGDVNSGSLFSEKRVFVVSLATVSLLKGIEKLFDSYIQQPNPDAIFIIRAKSFEYRNRSSAWFKFLAKHATVVIAEQLFPPQTRQWILSRASHLNLNLSREAVAHLCDITEGNLLAARNELEKLRLTYWESNQEIHPEAITNLNWRAANTFEVLDSACFGNVKAVGKGLESLKLEGIEMLFVLNLVSTQLRRIHSVALGESLRLSPRRMRPILSVVRRLDLNQIQCLMIECTHLDSQRKGILTGSYWDGIENLLLALAGHPVLSVIEENWHWHQIEYETS